MHKFWNFSASTENANTEDLHIDGDIVDDNDAWLYEWLGIPCGSPNLLRRELNKRKGKCLNVWINSPGGSVFAGAGIYNALREFDGKVTTIVDGIAASSASIIAMAGDTVEITPVGMLMIHNPMGSMRGMGYAKDFRRIADALDKIATTIANAYVLKTGIDRNELTRMMEEETYMSPGEAVRLKFADAVRKSKASDGEHIDVVNSMYCRASSIGRDEDRLNTALASLAARLKADEGTPDDAPNTPEDEHSDPNLGTPKGDLARCQKASQERSNFLNKQLHIPTNSGEAVKANLNLETPLSDVENHRREACDQAREKEQAEQELLVAKQRFALRTRLMGAR